MARRQSLFLPKNSYIAIICISNLFLGPMELCAQNLRWWKENNWHISNTTNLFFNGSIKEPYNFLFRHLLLSDRFIWSKVGTYMLQIIWWLQFNANCWDLGKFCSPELYRTGKKVFWKNHVTSYKGPFINQIVNNSICCKHQ